MSCEDWTTFDLARECSWPHLLYVQACVGRGCTSAASLACFGVTEHPLTSKTKGAGFLALDWFSESHNHFLRGLFLHCLRSDWVILFVPCHRGPRRVGYITCRCKCTAICWKTKKHAGPGSNYLFCSCYNIIVSRYEQKIPNHLFLFIMRDWRLDVISLGPQSWHMFCLSFYSDLTQHISHISESFN